MTEIFPLPLASRSAGISNFGISKKSTVFDDEEVGHDDLSSEKEQVIATKNKRTLAMAGDIKRIFDFGDPVMIYEATSALHNDIVAQKKKLDLITSKNQHLVPSLCLLWDYLSGSNPVASRSCGCIVVQLVKAIALDAEYAQQQLLNAAKVAKCPVSVLHSMTDLLIAISKTEGSASFPNVSQHPLVQLIRIRPSLMPEVLVSMDRIGSTLGHGHAFLPAAFLLLTPDTNAYHRDLVFAWMCDRAAKGDIEMESFWNAFSFLPKVTDWKSLQVVLRSEAIVTRVQDLVAFAVFDQICAVGAVEKADFSKEFCYLERTVPHMKSGSLNLFAVQFSAILLRLPSDYWKPALNVVELVLRHVCPVYANLFFAPLVNLNSMIGQLKSIGLSSEEFLSMPKFIQSSLAALSTKSQNSICPVHGNCTGIQTVLDALCQFPKMVLPFLQALYRKAIAPSEMNLNLLASLLVLHRGDKAVASVCCEAVVKLVEKDPAKVSMVLPAFIQAASKELMTGASEEATVLEFLPKLAVHHVCTPTILRFILGLTNGPKTREHGYRLLEILYERQPFIYRQITGLFDKLVTAGDEQLLVLRMELLLTICKVNGGEHGDDLATILTSVINKPIDITRESAVKSLALAVKAIGELCRWEVLQPDIIWKKLYGKLGKNSGPLLCSLCEFAGILGEISSDADEEETSNMAAINAQVLQFLWNTACSAKTDLSCRSAALRAFSKFDFRYIPSSVFGTEVPRTKEIEEEKKGMPGDLIFTLLEYLEDENLEAFSLLLSKLISAETETLGRGAYYNAKMMASKQSAASASLEDFCSSLSAKFTQGGTLADGSSAVAVLLVYEPPEELSQRGGDVMKKSIIIAGRYYLRVLGELLKTVPFEDCANWRRALITPFGWIKFMERTYAAVISSRQSEIELAKIADKQQEMDSAHLWARDKVVEILKATWRQDGDARPNCSISLAALCLAVKNFSSNNAQSNTRSSNASYMDNRHWITLVAETLFGLAAIDHSPTSQDLMFETLDMAPDLSVSNASRLGISLFLPAIREDVFDFYGNGIFERFSSSLADSASSSEKQPSYDYSTAFYNLLALGYYQGQLAHLGASIDQTQVLSPDRYGNAGGWLSAAVCAVFADDVQLAESMVNIMMEYAKSKDLADLDRQSAVAIIGLIVLVMYPDPGQFIRSQLCNRLEEYWSSVEKPGFVSKIYGAVSKESHRQSISTHMNKLNKKDVPLSDVIGDFQWLCSSCGADYYPLVFAGRTKKLDGDDRTILNELCKFSKSHLSKEVDDTNQLLRGECLLSLASVAFSTKFALANSSESALPSDYEYLEDSSVLRHSVAYLLGGKGSERRVQSVLKALTAERTKSLPPIDWDRVYDALDVDARTRMDEDIVTLAAKERSAALISKVAHPTWVLKATLAARLRLLENLRTVATVLPTSGLRRFLKGLPRLEEVDGHEFDSVLTAAFKGLRSIFSASASDKEGSVSAGNLATVWNWAVEACQFLRVESYNDFRRPVVQHFVDAVVEADQVKVGNLIREISRNELLAFSIWVSSLLRRKDDRASTGKMEKVMEAYTELGSSWRPSALRILMHELADGPAGEKDKETGVLHLMNLTLMLCKKYGGKKNEENASQISVVFDVFLASVTAWFDYEGSLPPYLLDETSTDTELDAVHDALIVEKVLFSGTSRQFAGYIRRSANRKFSEKVIEWALQMLPMMNMLENPPAAVVKDVLQRSRSDEFYIRKLQDAAVAEAILAYGCGMSMRSS